MIKEVLSSIIQLILRSYDHKFDNMIRTRASRIISEEITSDYKQFICNKSETLRNKHYSLKLLNIISQIVNIIYMAGL